MWCFCYAAPQASTEDGVRDPSVPEPAGGRGVNRALGAWRRGRPVPPLRRACPDAVMMISASVRTERELSKGRRQTGTKSGRYFARCGPISGRAGGQVVGRPDPADASSRGSDGRRGREKRAHPLSGGFYGRTSGEGSATCFSAKFAGRGRSHRPQRTCNNLKPLGVFRPSGPFGNIPIPFPHHEAFPTSDDAVRTSAPVR